MPVDGFTEEQLMEVRAGSWALEVLPTLDEQARHLVTFAEAALRSARTIFSLVERVSEEPYRVSIENIDD